MNKSFRKAIAIHQPNYLPWLGYFYKIYIADVFVFHDDVQFSKKGMHNYTYIKTPEGPLRLKYPVQQNHGDLINEVYSKDELGWKEKHIAKLEFSYRKANYFKEIINDYKVLIFKEYDNISLLNISLIKFYAKKLGFKTEYIMASDLGIPLKKEEKVIALCKALEGNIYYSGTGAKIYQKEENFSFVGIDLRYSVFKPFDYQQLWGEFQSNVSALDFFMNCGYDWDRVLKSQKKHFG